MNVDAVEVRTSDKVKGSAVPDGYVHIVVEGIIAADDAVTLAEQAADGVQFDVSPTTQRSSLSDDGYERVRTERNLLRSRHRL